MDRVFVPVLVCYRKNLCEEPLADPRNIIDCSHWLQRRNWYHTACSGDIFAHSDTLSRTDVFR
jgi:hypothetical protein